MFALRPEAAINRVWLVRGRVHVIPLPTSARPELQVCETNIELVVTR